MKKYLLLDISDSNGRDAGSKARNDALCILEKNGCRPFFFFNRSHAAVLRVLETAVSVFRLFLMRRSVDVLFIQYPYRPQITALIFRALGKNFRGKTVLLIHDVLYLRNDPSDVQYRSTDALREKEISLFNRASLLLIQNAAMAARLKSDGCTAEYSELGVFDYLCEEETVQSVPPGDTNTRIAYAGNLNPAKSGFLYRSPLPSGFSYHLYGNGFTASDTGSTVYHGSFPPDRLPAELTADYGLVWDGTDSNTCAGNYGNYLRYNSPHKLSLYLAAGLPVIVWSESALAGFVTENRLGVAVDSLGSLGSALPKPGSEAYLTLKASAETFGKTLRSGGSLTRLLTENNL